MTTTNTSAKGARLERAIAKALVAKGWSAVRGAGSKSYGPGKIDIIAINPIRRQVWLIQCKNHAKNPLQHGEKDGIEMEWGGAERPKEIIGLGKPAPCMLS